MAVDLAGFVESWVDVDALFLYQLAFGLLVLAMFAFFSGPYLITPYGRFNQQGSRNSSFGPDVNAKFAWFFFESPTVIAPPLFFYLNRNNPALATPFNSFILGFYFFHYVYRTLIYPLRTRHGKPMPLLLLPFIFSVSLVNAYIQSQFLTRIPINSTAPQFIIGAFLFFSGWLITFHSDNILCNLRSKPNSSNANEKNPSGYRIPTGGFFEWVTSANYFGEIVEWFGYAVASGFSLPSVAFLFLTCSNLIPRALHYHKWYQNNFVHYPKSRKAIIPFVL